jgi:hypothetical protein
MTGGFVSGPALHIRPGTDLDLSDKVHNTADDETATLKPPQTAGNNSLRHWTVEDAPSVTHLMDLAVAWLNAQGNTQQWGSELWIAEAPNPSSLLPPRHHHHHHHHHHQQHHVCSSGNVRACRNDHLSGISSFWIRKCLCRIGRAATSGSDTYVYVKCATPHQPTKDPSRPNRKMIVSVPIRSIQSRRTVPLSAHRCDSDSHFVPIVQSARQDNIYQMSSLFLTMATVGVLGSILFIRLRSSLVTRLGVMGMTGENGW